jgi:transcriptional regulator with XRE-family HTH domain
MKKWSQETLASLTGLSVRTVQRIEKGESSDLDTRRALARAFEFDDIDVFNKPYSIPTEKELKAQREKLEREYVTLDATIATTGRELIRAAEGTHFSYIHPAIELSGEAEHDFAALADCLRDYGDCADLYSEVQKLDIYAEIKDYVGALSNAGVSVCYAQRMVKFVGKDSADKTPWAARIIYIAAFEKGKEPKQLLVARTIHL